MENTTEKLELTILNDYDNTFKSRVEAAIKLANEAGEAIIYNRIIVTSGPFRNYCFAFEAIGNTVRLDFYSAARVFGFTHSIEEIKNVLIGKKD